MSILERSGIFHFSKACAQIGTVWFLSGSSSSNRVLLDSKRRGHGTVISSSIGPRMDSLLYSASEFKIKEMGIHWHTRRQSETGHGVAHLNLNTCRMRQEIINLGPLWATYQIKCHPGLFSKTLCLKWINSGQRFGSAVKSTCWSHKGPKFGFQHQHWMTHNCLEPQL